MLRDDKDEFQRLLILVRILIGFSIVVAILGLISCSVAYGKTNKELQIKAAIDWVDRYIDVHHRDVSVEDVDLLAQVMYHENGMNGDAVMYYTGAVVMNRVHHKGYPDTVKGVLYAKGQYSTTPLFFTKKIPFGVYCLAARILKLGTVGVPENVVYQAMFPQGSGVWKPIPSSYSKDDIEYFCYE